MVEEDKVEKAISHFKRVLGIAGILADEDMIQELLGSLLSSLQELRYPSRYYSDSDQPSFDPFQRAEQFLIFQIIQSLAPDSRTPSDEERLKAKERVRSAIRHTLLTDKLKFTPEQVEYVEDKVFQIFENIARTPFADRERVYQDFEYYDLGLTESLGESGTASASAS